MIIAEYGRHPLQIRVWQQFLRYHNRAVSLRESCLDKSRWLMVSGNLTLVIFVQPSQFRRFRTFTGLTCAISPTHGESKSCIATETFLSSLSRSRLVGLKAFFMTQYITVYRDITHQAFLTNSGIFHLVLNNPMNRAVTSRHALLVDSLSSLHRYHC